MINSSCDFCGKKANVERTHFGSGFGYVRLICSDCRKELGAEIIESSNNKIIRSYGDFYSMTKKQISNYLCRKGFGCCASLKQTKDQLLFNAIEIYKKYGA